MQSYLNEHYAPTTVQTMSRDIANYQSQCPEAATASHKEVIQYLGQLRQRYPNPATLTRILCSLKAWYDFLIFTGARTDNPARSICLRDQINKAVQLQDLFIPEELESLPDYITSSGVMLLRDKVLLTLLIYQALQPKELEALQESDINLDNATLYIRSTPTTQSRTLQLKPQQVLLFYRYQQQRPLLLKKKHTLNWLLTYRGNPFTSAEITHHIHKSFKALYTPRKVNCRTIRQSVLHNLLKAGHNLRAVQTLAGHKGPSSTKMYQTDQLDELKKDIRDYHPIR